MPQHPMRLLLALALALSTLAVNIFPQGTSAMPVYEKLGAPPEFKKIVYFDGGHEAPPRAMFVSETVAWLDRFQ